MVYKKIHLLEDNYFELLFHAHTLLYERNIIEGICEKRVPSKFQYDSSTMVLFLLELMDRPIGLIQHWG
jgi:hypothetical protein